MSGSIFEFISAYIEQYTELERLQARGLVRLALRDAGFEPDGIGAEHVGPVARSTLLARLEAGGVSREEASQIVEGLVENVPRGDDTPLQGPEAMLARLSRLRR